MVVRSSEGTHRADVHGTTDLLGAFEVVVEPRGTLTLVVDLPGHVRHREERSIPSVDHWRLLLNVGGSCAIQGTVLADVDGSPLSDVLVSIDSLDEAGTHHTSGSTTSDVSGRFEIVGLLPGSYSITASTANAPRGDASPNGLRLRDLAMELQPGEQKEVSLRAKLGDHR